MKKMRVVFFDHEEDMRLLKASIAALDSNVLSQRFGYTIERNDEAKTTTLFFWRLPGGTDAK